MFDFRAIINPRRFRNKILLCNNGHFLQCIVFFDQFAKQTNMRLFIAQPVRDYRISD